MSISATLANAMQSQRTTPISYHSNKRVQTSQENSTKPMNLTQSSVGSGIVGPISYHGVSGASGSYHTKA